MSFEIPLHCILSKIYSVRDLSYDFHFIGQIFLAYYKTIKIQTKSSFVFGKREWKKNKKKNSWKTGNFSMASAKIWESSKTKLMSEA